MKVIILGSGIIGATTAYYLNNAGYEVTVIDRNTTAAMECSFQNGGQLSFGHTEPWANPTLPKYLLKWLIKPNSPLSFSQLPNLAMLNWSLKFMLNCTSKKAAASAEQLFFLTNLSKNCLSDYIQANPNIDFNHSSTGTLHIFNNIKAFEAAKKLAYQLSSYGLNSVELKNHDEILTHEPALQHSSQQFSKGIYYPDDAAGDSHLFTQQLCDLLKNRGVSFIYNCHIDDIKSDSARKTITSILTSKGSFKADAYVMALGAHSRILTDRLGLKITLYPKKGYSISTMITNDADAPRINITDHEHKIVFSKLGNNLRIAGMAEFAKFNSAISPKRIATLKHLSGSLFPSAANYDNTKDWACLRPATPDGLPIIGSTSYNNLYLNTGHGTLGWTLSMGSAKILSDVITKNSTPFDISAFNLARF